MFLRPSTNTFHDRFSSNVLFVTFLVADYLIRSSLFCLDVRNKMFSSNFEFTVRHILAFFFSADKSSLGVSLSKEFYRMYFAFEIQDKSEV